MATDTARRRIVLYRPQLIPHTFEFDGIEWRSVSTAHSPTPPIVFNEFALAYDSVRRLTMLLIGRGPSGQLELWEYDGVDWRLSGSQPPPMQVTQISPSVSVLVHDPIRDELMLMYVEAFSPRGSPRMGMRVRRANGTWRSLSIGAIPLTVSGGAFSRNSFVFHPGRGRVLYLPFEGFGFREWDGSSWREVRVATPPFSILEMPKTLFGSAYDEHSSLLVISGGRRGASCISRTFGYDLVRNAWLEISPGRSLSAPTRVALSSSPDGVGVFAAGGYACDSNPSLAVWRLAGTVGQFSDLGPGCVGSSGTPRIAQRPGATAAIGGVVALEISGLPQLPQGTAFGVVGVDPIQPVSLDGIGMPGCTLYSSANYSTTLRSVQGRVRWDVSVPDVGELLGASIDVQAAVLDAAANVTGVTMSNGLRCTLGAR